MATNTLAARGRTGEECEVSGRYDFDGYLDGTHHPEPRPEEKRIPLAKGNTFPPVRSSGRSCYWRLIERI